MLGLASFLAILFGAAFMVDTSQRGTPKNIKHRMALFFTGLLMVVLGIYGAGKASDIKRAEHKERLARISKNSDLKTRYLQCINTPKSNPADCSKEVFIVYSKYGEELRKLESLKSQRGGGEN